MQQFPSYVLNSLPLLAVRYWFNFTLNCPWESPSHSSQRILHQVVIRLTCTLLSLHTEESPNPGNLTVKNHGHETTWILFWGLLSSAVRTCDQNGSELWTTMGWGVSEYEPGVSSASLYRWWRLNLSFSHDDRLFYHCLILTFYLMQGRALRPRGLLTWFLRCEAQACPAHKGTVEPSTLHLVDLYWEQNPLSGSLAVALTGNPTNPV